MSAALAFIEALLVAVLRAAIYCVIAIVVNGIIILFFFAIGDEKGTTTIGTISVVTIFGLFMYLVFFISTIISYYRPFYWPVQQNQKSETLWRFVARAPIIIYLWFSAKLDRPNSEFYYTLYLFFSASCWFAVALLMASGLRGDSIPTAAVIAAVYDAALHTIDLFLKGMLLDFSEHFQLEIHNRFGELKGTVFLLFTFSYRTLAGLIGLGAILKIVDLIKLEISKL